MHSFSRPGELLLIVLMSLLAGCAGRGDYQKRPDYPSQGVVQWQQQQALLPAQLAGDIRQTFERLRVEAGVDSHFVISGSREPNAHATITDAGPTVILNAGLIDIIGWDADGAAFVLGHELAHIRLNHLSRSRLKKQRQQDGLSGILGAVAGALVPFGGLVVDVGNEMIKASYSRDQERDADRLGLQLMAASGYDPQGAIRFHRQLLALDGGRLIPFLSSHPSGEERISRLQSLIAEMQTDAVRR